MGRRTDRGRHTRGQGKAPRTHSRPHPLLNASLKLNKPSNQQEGAGRRRLAVLSPIPSGKITAWVSVHSSQESFVMRTVNQVPGWTTITSAFGDKAIPGMRV